MAFQLRNLAPAGNPSKGVSSIASGALGYGAPRIWTYVTEDAHTDVDAAGYFNGGVAYGGAYNLLNVADIIYVVVCSAGAVSTYGPHLVNSKSAGTIDVTNVTTGTVTDSD